MMWPKNNKASLDAITGIAIGVLVVIIAIGTALTVGEAFRDSIATPECVANASLCSEAYDATGELMTEAAKLPSWVGIIVTVSIAASILGLVALFRMRQ